MNNPEIVAAIVLIIGAIVGYIKAKTNRENTENKALEYVNMRVREQDKKLDSLENKLERLSKEKNKLEDRIIELESSLKMAQQTSTQRGKDLEIFREQVSSLEGKLKELTDEFYRVLKENDATTRELSIKNAEVLTLQKQLTDCHKLAEELQNQLDEYMDGKIQ